MLYTQTVAPETLELLKRLESEPFMDSFSLAGGTALALYLGHRVYRSLSFYRIICRRASGSSSLKLER